VTGPKSLSIIHFWGADLPLYLGLAAPFWHYTALPEFGSTLGMVFSIVLWMPSWGGMKSRALMDSCRAQWETSCAPTDHPQFMVTPIGLLRHVHL